MKVEGGGGLSGGGNDSCMIATVEGWTSVKGAGRG